MNYPAFAVGTAVLLVACEFSLKPADDGFQAKLAAGCNSKEACDALFAEAWKRSIPCGDPRGAGCDQINEDLKRASNLQQRQNEAWVATRRENEEDRIERRAAEIRAARLAQAADAGNDVAMAKAPEDGGAADPMCLDLNRDELWRIPNDLEARLLHRPFVLITNSLTSTVRAPGDADLEASRKGVAATRDLVVKLRCVDPAKAARLSRRVEEWAEIWRKAISEEETCRATPTCLADREAKPLCVAIIERQKALRDIALERRNPAGVVDLNYLHDLGETVQTDDETIATGRAKYAAAMHKPFNPARCPKEP